MCRLFLSLTLASIVSVVHAEQFPSSPIKIIVPYAPGGVVDGLLRAIANEASPGLKQSVIIENKPGASTLIGMGACSNAKPDGYTLCATVPDSLTYNPLLFKKLPYDAVNGFTPLTNLALSGGLLAATAPAPFDNFQQMIDYARRNPGKLNWGTWGTGSIPHIYAEWMKKTFNVNFTLIPYKGTAQAAPALVAGDIHLTYMGIGLASELIAGGKIKPIVLMAPQRVASLPNVPLQTELGADPGLQTYFGVFGPARMPPEVVDKLSREFARAAKSPAVATFMKNNYLVPVGSTPQEFQAYLDLKRQQAERQFRELDIKPTDLPN